MAAVSNSEPIEVSQVVPKGSVVLILDADQKKTLRNTFLWWMLLSLAVGVLAGRASTRLV
jgi:hypothetical protein